MKEVPIPTPSGLSPGDPWLKKWVVAARVPFLTASVLPVVASVAACWRLEHAIGHAIDFGHALLAIFGIAFVHLGVNLSNDYYDHLSGTDVVNRVPTPFSGGSRVIQEGIVSPRAVLVAALACYAAGAACGIYLSLCSPAGYTLLLIGLAGVTVGWFYTAPPLKLAHRGVGEAATALGFGVLPAMGTEWVLRGRISFEGSWVGLPAGLLVALILLINEFPDLEADAAVGKRTLVVRLGQRRAAMVYVAALLVAYASVGAGVVLGWMPPQAAVVVLAAPLSWRVVRQLRAGYADVRALLPAMAGTILQQALFLLLLAGACVADLALPLWR